MLSEMNNNEEQYIRARLDELPSWVNQIYSRKTIKFLYFF